MTTLDDLRKRLEKRYLEPISERTPQVGITGAISDSDTTMTLKAGVMSPDVESMIGPGTVFELEYEMVEVEAYDQSTKAVTIERGAEDSTAVSHIVGTKARWPTRWPRSEQAEALREGLDALWPPLYVEDSQVATLETARYLPLPLDTRTILAVRWQDRDGRWVDASGELLLPHPFDVDLAAVQPDHTVGIGALCSLRYGRAASVPDDETEPITNLPALFAQIAVVAAAAALMSGVDIDAATQEYLSQQYRLERFPVRSGSHITQSLIQYKEYLEKDAVDALTALNPKPIVFLDTEYVY
jgi:hypothetical protein